MTRSGVSSIRALLEAGVSMFMSVVQLATNRMRARSDGNESYQQSLGAECPEAILLQLRSPRCPVLLSWDA
jgi:hypothetical protein